MNLANPFEEAVGTPEKSLANYCFEMNLAPVPNCNPNPLVDPKALIGTIQSEMISEETTTATATKTTQSPNSTHPLRERRSTRKRRQRHRSNATTIMDHFSSDTSAHNEEDPLLVVLHSPPVSPQSKQRKRARTSHRMPWEQRLDQLRDYRSKHGDLLIPIRFKENPSLGKFVHNTREQFKLYQKPPGDTGGKAKRCSLTAERVRQLEELGFVWSTERTKHQKEDWEARLQQLRDYKSKHGDCLVPHGYPEDPSFAEWVHRQRTTHAHMVKEDERHHHHNPLVEERMKQLEDIGFHFTVHADKWHEHWTELKQYKDTHGHCQVPTHCQSNPKLGRWVHTQRHQRRLQLKGKKSCMTDERVQLLNSLGFSWEVRPHHHKAEFHGPEEDSEIFAEVVEDTGENNGFGDLLSSVHSEDLNPERHSPCDNSGNEAIAVPVPEGVPIPDLECTFQAHQDGSQVDLFAQGMTMV